MQWFIDLIFSMLSTRIGFVSRTCITSPDFTKATLTLDGLTHVLDLSGIVPVNARCVMLKVDINGPATPPKTGNLFPVYCTISAIGQRLSTFAVNRDEPHNVLVQLDLTQSIKYNFENVAWNTVNIWVRGWWLNSFVTP